MFPPGCLGTNFVTSYTRSCTMTQQSVERLCFATSPAVKTFSRAFVDFFSLSDRRRTDEEEVEGIVASGLHIPKVGGGGECEEERLDTRAAKRERYSSLFSFLCRSCGPQKLEFFEKDEKCKNRKKRSNEASNALEKKARKQSESIRICSCVDGK